MRPLLSIALLFLVAGCDPGGGPAGGPASAAPGVDLGVGAAGAVESTPAASAPRGSGAAPEPPRSIGGGAVRTTRELLERLTPAPGGSRCTAPVAVDVEVTDPSGQSLEEQVFGTRAGQVSVRETEGPCP